MEHNEQFNRIYAETRDDLLRYLMLRTNAAPEAEDLFQEVYRKLFIRLKRSALPILDTKRYVFAIAKKELSRFIGKRRNGRKRSSRSKRTQKSRRMKRRSTSSCSKRSACTRSGGFWSGNRS